MNDKLLARFVCRYCGDYIDKHDLASDGLNCDRMVTGPDGTEYATGFQAVNDSATCQVCVDSDCSACADPWAAHDVPWSGKAGA